MGVVDLGQVHKRELIVDLSCFLTCMLGGVRFYYYVLTMSLYRFFTKAGMPSRVPSLSDKEIENANTSTMSTYVWIERARAWAWLYSQVSRPPNLNRPIFLFTLIGANPPNLMPAKFSGYTVIPIFGYFYECALQSRWLSPL